jgi:hypothetical protein
MQVICLADCQVYSYIADPDDALFSSGKMCAHLAARPVVRSLRIKTTITTSNNNRSNNIMPMGVYCDSAVCGAVATAQRNTSHRSATASTARRKRDRDGYRGKSLPCASCPTD